MKSNKNILKAFILLIFLSIFSISLKFENGSDLLVYYLDVGQGDSALIETPNGTQVLIDAGKNEKVIDQLEQVIPFWDRHIDLLIFSHGDLDHIGGFFEVLETYKVGKILRAQTEVDSKYEKELLKKAKNLNIEIQEIGKGDKIILDQENKIYLEVYSPIKENLVDSNETSLVMELIHNENEFLFTGDIDINTESEIVEIFEKEIDTDVLKVAHHGSKTSTSEIFLQKATPEFSIISYGENSYGHPNSEVLKRLDQSGSLIFQTKDRGTIIARSNGESLKVDYLGVLFQDSSFFKSFISSVFVDSFDPFS